MGNLIVFIPGLNGDPKKWSRVSTQIGSTPADFEVIQLAYSAAKTSPSTVETSANRLLTDLEKYSHHDAIFLVGYSLGGLVARELCRQLLVADASKDAILRKIKAVIAVGDPLDGAGAWRVPILAPAWNAILRRAPFATKVRQIASPEVTFDNYQKAINLRLERQAADPTRRVARPKIIHIKIEDDTTAVTTQKFYTVDDQDGGTIPGTHSRFADDPSSAEQVADLLLRKIRGVQNIVKQPQALEPQSSPAEQESDVGLAPYLILVACSRTKNTGGNPGYEGVQPVAWVNEPYLRDRIVGKRSYVYGLLKDYKIDDAFQEGRNRIYSQSNKALEHGPDLGGVKSFGEKCLYMPAWERYSGRTYAEVDRTVWERHVSNPKAGVLIMSGLYGLIDVSEKIQDYDIHLSDTDPNGQTIKGMWAELYTDTVKHYVTQAYRGKRVKIFNLLCDLNYVTAIEWLDLPRDKCTVYHLASPTLKDKKLLPVAGTVLSRFLSEPEKMDVVERGQLLSLSEFGKAPPKMSDLQIIFERHFGDSRSESREEGAA